LILAYFDVGVLSFLIPVVIVGLVIGFFEDSIDSALVVGGVAGLIVSILHVTILLLCYLHKLLIYAVMFKE
jgi:hypothetical protein